MTKLKFYGNITMDVRTGKNINKRLNITKRIGHFSLNN